MDIEKMYKYTRAILKDVINTQSSSFDEKLEVDLNTIHKAYNFIESQQQEIDRFKGEGWISVEDRLPEAGIQVLCYVKSYNDFKIVNDCATVVESFDYGIEAMVSEDDRLFTTNDFFDGEDMITHWQPLPKAPEVGYDRG